MKYTKALQHFNDDEITGTIDLNSMIEGTRRLLSWCTCEARR